MHAVANEDGHFLPNKIGRILLLSLEEVIGHNGVNAVLNVAELPDLIRNYPPNTIDREFGFSAVGRIQQALDRLYGQRAGHGLALRTGRAGFKHALREFGPMLGMTELSYRLLPLHMKLKSGLERTAELFNRHTDQTVHLEETPEAYRFHMDLCPLCWGRRLDQPGCHLAVGFFQEGLTWVSGGKDFLVEETACAACGDAACVLRIVRQPLD
jgi:predicted hydrocarbon binding protein